MKPINQTKSLFQNGNQEELFTDLGYLESFELAKKADGFRSVIGVSFFKVGNYSISFEKINKSWSNYLNYLGVTFILKFP
jgi:hypothetical protein